VQFLEMIYKHFFSEEFEPRSNTDLELVLAALVDATEILFEDKLEEDIDLSWMDFFFKAFFDNIDSTCANKASKSIEELSGGGLCLAFSCRESFVFCQ